MHYLVVESIVFFDNFCDTKFPAYYTVDNKPDHSSKYHPDEF